MNRSAELLKDYYPGKVLVEIKTEEEWREFNNIQPHKHVFDSDIGKVTIGFSKTPSKVYALRCSCGDYRII